MKIHQVSVFAENKPGHITEPLRLLADAGINLRALSLADTQEFGVLRMIVAAPERAVQLLKEGGCAVKLTEVLAVEVPDRPGGLVDVLTALDGSGINIEYMYAYPYLNHGKAVLIFRFDDPDAALARLRGAKLRVLSSAELLKNE